MIIETQPGRLTGDSVELMMLPTVDDVTGRLFAVTDKVNNRAGISLLGYGMTVTAVYGARAWPMRPRGFDFRCGDVDTLIDDVLAVTAKPRTPQSSTDFSNPNDANKNAVFNEDRSDNIGGKFSAGDAEGRSFRQIGTGGEVLHLELQLNGKCNAHFDSHGYVAGPDDYDWGLNALRHGYWDLLSDEVPILYRRIGTDGGVGPMAFRPILGLDGHIIWGFGVTGYF